MLASLDRVRWHERGVVAAGTATASVLSTIVESLSCYALILDTRAGNVRCTELLRVQALSCPVLATMRGNEDVSDYARVVDWCVGTRAALCFEGGGTCTARILSSLASDAEDARSQLARYIQTVRQIRVVGTRNSLASMRTMPFDRTRVMKNDKLISAKRACTVITGASVVLGARIQDRASRSSSRSTRAGPATAWTTLPRAQRTWRDVLCQWSSDSIVIVNCE